MILCFLSILINIYLNQLNQGGLGFERRSFFFLGFDCYRLNCQWFNVFVVNEAFQDWWIIVDQCWWLGVHNKINFSWWIYSAHFPGIQFFELAFPFDHLWLGLSFHKEFTHSVFQNPLTFFRASCKAKIDDITCVINKLLRFLTGFPYASTSLSSRLKFLYLYRIYGSCCFA